MVWDSPGALEVSPLQTRPPEDTFWGKGFLTTIERNSKPRPQKDPKETAAFRGRREGVPLSGWLAGGRTWRGDRGGSPRK